MKLKLFKVICLFCFFGVVIFNYNAGVCDSNHQNNIKDGDIVLFDRGLFIIKFSNIIYEENGREIKIPIFQGTSVDVYYNQFLDYCRNNKLLKKKIVETGFIIETERGNITRTFRESLLFYKGNILKDVEIEKPARIATDDSGRGLHIFYEFVADGVPFVLEIATIAKDQFPIGDGIKSVLNINKIKLDETIAKPHFRFRFYKNCKSDVLPIL